MGSDSTINARVLHRKRGQTELKPLSVSLTLLVNKSLYLIPQAQCIDSDQFEISESYNSVLNTSPILWCNNRSYAQTDFLSFEDKTNFFQAEST